MVRGPRVSSRVETTKMPTGASPFTCHRRFSGTGVASELFSDQPNLREFARQIVNWPIGRHQGELVRARRLASLRGQLCQLPFGRHRSQLGKLWARMVWL